MNTHAATIVVDLGFGDAGKGTIVDALTRRMPNATIVRFNGGAQAAHNVVTSDGRHHTFAQFGSGSFVPNTKTHLSRFMLIDPISMQAEARHLEHLGCGNVFSRLTVDEEALVVTPFMKAANRLRETLRADGRHGSCGLGIGETQKYFLDHPDDAIHARDLRDPEELFRKLLRQQEVTFEEFRSRFEDIRAIPEARSEAVILNDPTQPRLWAHSLVDLSRRFTIVPGSYLGKLARRGSLIFEGAQGVLIDEWHGFHPFTTWSTTTFANALTLLRDIDYSDPVQRLGVLRSYAVRHGPGPFPTEDLALTTQLPDKENVTGRWQGAFRVGWFDLVLMKYALAVCGGADTIALTHLDRFATINHPRVCTHYERSDGERVSSFTPKTILIDLTYQEQLTARLQSITPVYQPVEHETALCHLIEAQVGIPIAITSYGVTADDKRFRDEPVISAT